MLKQKKMRKEDNNPNLDKVRYFSGEDKNANLEKIRNLS